MFLLSPGFLELVLLSVLVLIISMVGCYFYPHLALKCGAVATPNFRSLHYQATPKGAGIVVASVVLLALLMSSFVGLISFNECLLVLVGGLVVSVVGFIDDCGELSAKFRLFIQLVIAFWVYFWFANGSSLNLGFAIIEIGVFKLLLTLFLLVWFYNWFNFIDGSDGMAASAVIYVALLFSIIFFLESQQTLLLLLLLLGSATLGFMIFNWPPAKVFFGDIGTSFCSYVLSIVVVISVWQNGLNLWVWIIALGYYVSDTVLTTLIRLFKFPKTWYQPHRSHAYQNLARLIGHLKILTLIWVFNLLWFLPLAIFAYFLPKYSILFFIMAYGAIIPFILKYGPLYRFKD